MSLAIQKSFGPTVGLEISVSMLLNHCNDIGHFSIIWEMEYTKVGLGIGSNEIYDVIYILMCVRMGSGWSHAINQGILTLLFYGSLFHTCSIVSPVYGIMKGFYGTELSNYKECNVDWAITHSHSTGQNQWYYRQKLKSSW